MPNPAKSRAPFDCSWTPRRATIANPEPDDPFTLKYADGLVLSFHWELAKQLPESSVRPGFHILSGSRVVVRPAASSTRASSANAFRTSWEPANRRVHSSSDASSDCSHPAIRSCSSAGRDDILEKTLSRARVVLQAYCLGGCRTRCRLIWSPQRPRRSYEVGTLVDA